jgi:hypothetical protein
MDDDRTQRCVRDIEEHRRRAYIASRTTTAETRPPSGVRTPASDLMAVREKEPVAGYALKKGPKMFVNPMAMSSWDGRMV